MTRAAIVSAIMFLIFGFCFMHKTVSTSFDFKKYQKEQLIAIIPEPVKPELVVSDSSKYF